MTTTKDLTLDGAIEALQYSYPEATVSISSEMASNYHAAGRRIRREIYASIQPKSGGVFLYHAETIRDAVNKAIAAKGVK